MQSRIRGDDELQEIDISVYDTDLINQTMEDVEFLLRDTRGLDDTEENDFRMSSFVDVLSTVQTITGLLTTMIAGISGISLVVGGVGVMNIMLVSVTERTKEIGIRKAVGAKHSAIMAQFLFEAIALSVVGGIIGMALGFGVAALVNAVSPVPAQVRWWSVALGIGFSAAVGIFFGYFPAKSAAAKDPIECLRYE
ncbi:FtsX-like permease family protein, partial [bacterium]|nr:FtsX-like permease family protein [bacterium]